MGYTPLVVKRPTLRTAPGGAPRASAASVASSGQAAGATEDGPSTSGRSQPHTPTSAQQQHQRGVSSTTTTHTWQAHLAQQRQQQARGTVQSMATRSGARRSAAASLDDAGSQDDVAGQPDQGRPAGPSCAQLHCALLAPVRITAAAAPSRPPVADPASTADRLQRLKELRQRGAELAAALGPEPCKPQAQGATPTHAGLVTPGAPAGQLGSGAGGAPTGATPSSRSSIGTLRRLARAEAVGRLEAWDDGGDDDVVGPQGQPDGGALGTPGGRLVVARSVGALQMLHRLKALQRLQSEGERLLQAMQAEEGGASTAAA